MLAANVDVDPIPYLNAQTNQVLKWKGRRAKSLEPLDFFTSIQRQAKAFKGNGKVSEFNGK